MCELAEKILPNFAFCRPSDEDVAVRNRLLQLEAGKRAVENELETTRRRLEQSEGGREALMTQIGTVHSHMFYTLKRYVKSKVIKM